MYNEVVTLFFLHHEKIMLYYLYTREDFVKKIFEEKIKNKNKKGGDLYGSKKESS